MRILSRSLADVFTMALAKFRLISSKITVRRTQSVYFFCLFEKKSKPLLTLWSQYAAISHGLNRDLKTWRGRSLEHLHWRNPIGNTYRRINHRKWLLISMHVTNQLHDLLMLSLVWQQRFTQSKFRMIHALFSASNLRARAHRLAKRTMCGFGLQRSFGRNILELLLYYLMPTKCKILKI